MNVRRLFARVRNIPLMWRLLRTARRGRKRGALALLWRGELDHARRRLARQSAPSARFELACLELEAGDDAAAERAANALPDTPARAVLRELIEQHPRGGAYRGGGPASWLDALDAAWRRAGCPDLHDSPYPSFDFRKSIDPGKRRACPDADTRAIWGWLSTNRGVLGWQQPRAVVTWALAEQPRSLADTVVACSVLGVAAAESPDLLPRYLAVLRRLDELAPGQLWVQLAAFAKRPGQALDVDALPELDAIIAAPVVDASVSPTVRDRLDAVARAAGSKTPEAVAFYGWMLALIASASAMVLVRLNAQTAPRVVERCVRLGRRMLEDRFVFSWLLGCALMAKGARLLGDQRVFDELAPYNEERGQFADTNRRVMLEPLRWPIPSLAREVFVEMYRNELAYARGRLRRELAARAANR